MASHRTLKPYLQGQLDGLCGIYATINAIRWALRAEGDYYSREDWQALLHVLLCVADDELGAATAIASGIETRPLRKLFKAATLHMADEHEVELTIRPVVRRGERASFRDLLPRLEELTARPRTAMLVGFAGHLDHWTVVRRITPASLSLFDSSGFSRVRADKCRMKLEPANASGRDHVLYPRSIFRAEIRE